MTDKEKQLYEDLMLTIYNKFRGHRDEQDVQRALGALYCRLQAENENQRKTIDYYITKTTQLLDENEKLKNDNEDLEEEVRRLRNVK